ncbi:hypothetical protein QJS04_geneDACA000423 [Acorus gramineus]|uniref:Uncharacterized protein n=1 Tax=Acorus gramineus TaxID=55184 RepID=A0AAV9AR84_ACOGR|nr:hypothetical protein QJS04_geneDACA000423 [Acorus gramineus]
MDPMKDKLVRRTAMVASVTAAYFLLTADYGAQPNALDPIKKAILSAEQSAKNFLFGSSDKHKEEKPKNETAATNQQK